MIVTRSRWIFATWTATAIAAVSLAGCTSTGSKKPTPQYAVPKTLASQPKKEESKGIGSWFKSEPQKPPDVPSWMDSTKRMEP
ncbi:MAG: hypothetical protein ABFC96_12940 [Thermoguttaceae bacterium]